MGKNNCLFHLKAYSLNSTPPPAQDVGALAQAHHICKALRPQDVEKMAAQKNWATKNGPLTKSPEV